VLLRPNSDHGLAIEKRNVPSLWPLQQVIESIAGNLACFGADELAETAYGLLLLGCNPATPNASVMAAAEFGALVETAGDETVGAVKVGRAAAAAAVAAVLCMMRGLRHGSFVATNGKGSPAVAPVLRQTYQQLLLVLEQQLVAGSYYIAGGVGAIYCWCCWSFCC
jgi:hypothetical protein